MNYIVYVIQDINGKVYVGTTSRKLKSRVNHGNGYRQNKELWKAICEYGWETFSYFPVAIGLSKEEASRIEKEYIAKYDSANPEKGYNRELGGIGKDKVIPKQCKRRMSETRMGPLNHNFGKPKTEEVKAKIAESNRGQKRSTETCLRIGLAKEKPVLQYTLDGLLINRFDSAKKAAQSTGVSYSHISKTCLNKQKSCGGFLWKFA